MISAWLYLMQRLTALIMAPLVIGHIIVMIYAVQGGLSAAEILGRTQGSIFWALFYGLFVVSVSVHATIGIRTVLFEWAHMRGAVLNIICSILCLGLLGLGLSSVYAVTI
tara:strand:- start:712 stop:1041 length:330 start_codon:yes stop_codon:yes gene_type:complete